MADKVKVSGGKGLHHSIQVNAPKKVSLMPTGGDYKKSLKDLTKKC